MKKALLMVAGLLLFASVTQALAALPASETALSEDGTAYEINPDNEGRLWITDYRAGEIWWVDPASGAYTRYTLPDSGNPSDARRSGDFFWWVDSVCKQICRATVENGNYICWAVPEATEFFATAIDATGSLWVTDLNSSTFYRFVPGQNNLCTYHLSNPGYTDYVVSYPGTIWIGSFLGGRARIYRIDTLSNGYVYWELQEYSTLIGMAVDEEGDLWYSDYVSQVVAEIHPGMAPTDPDVLTSYNYPNFSSPNNIAIDGDTIWFSNHNTQIGSLDTTVADNDTTILNNSVGGTFSPTCKDNLSSVSGELVVVNGFLAWNSTFYPMEYNQDGWQVISIPSGTASTQGITVLNEMVYAVDNGRQLLLRLPVHPPEYPNHVYLPLIER